MNFEYRVKRGAAAMGAIMLSAAIGFTACRKPDIVVPAEYETLPIKARSIESFADDEPIGMYLLNEGNMGSNKASIDYVDFVSGCYIRNIYSERNPNVVKELGDVGNDIQIYGNKLYAVINCSHKVEVMNARNCVRIGQIDIPNCRYIRFADGKAYVSAYVGEVAIDPNARKGAVYEVDTATLSITREVTVGYQPDELDIVGNYIYVANSGGYRVGNYENTVSVVDRRSMQEVKKIPVGLNLHRLRADRYGRLWVGARGDYGRVAQSLHLLEGTAADMVVSDTFDVSCAGFVINGDSLYYYGGAASSQNYPAYGVMNLRTKTVSEHSFIADGSEKAIKMPYCVAVNPYSGDIFVTDAKNYVSSGTLHCYGRDGQKKWSVRTGDIPAHIVFLYKFR